MLADCSCTPPVLPYFSHCALAFTTDAFTSSGSSADDADRVEAEAMDAMSTPEPPEDDPDEEAALLTIERRFRISFLRMEGSG